MTATAPSGAPEREERSRAESVAGQVMREILGGNAVLSILAVVLALVVSSLLIAFTNKDVQAASAYFFSRPGDTFAALGTTIADTFTSMFRGAIFNYQARDVLGQLKPLSDTLTWATPLIAAGLGVAVGFRVGLFNIGGRGQILIAAAFCGWVSWSLPLPPVVHMLVCVVAAIVGGAIWGGIVGLLKARTGAHEVIVTIMLNYVALNLVSFLLRTPGALQAPGTNTPKSPAPAESATMVSLTDLIGVGNFRVHVGLLIAIAATVFAWYLLERSSLGFRFRAVGENPAAARVAGIDVPRVYIYAMAISGGLVGIAGAVQVLGTNVGGFSSGIDADIGFDAITVALLGRSRPWGVFGAGILFGALKAGGYTLQLVGAPIDIVLVVQSLVVLFIAAPPLVRAVFRLPTPRGTLRPSRRGRVVEEAGE